MVVVYVVVFIAGLVVLYVLVVITVDIVVVVVGPRNLNLKFGQHWVINS